MDRPFNILKGMSTYSKVKMKIKFDVSFSYDSIEESFTAAIQVLIPACDDSLLPQIFRSKTTFLSEAMCIAWGYPHETDGKHYRRKRVYIHSKDKQRVQDEARNTIDQLTEEFLKIYEEIHTDIEMYTVEVD